MHLFHKWEYLTHPSGPRFRHCTRCHEWQHSEEQGNLSEWWYEWVPITPPPAAVLFIPHKEYERRTKLASDKAAYERQVGLWKELMNRQ